MNLYTTKAGRLVSPDDRFQPSIRYEMQWFPSRVSMFGGEYPAGEYPVQRTVVPLRDIFTGEKLLAYEDDLIPYSNHLLEDAEMEDE